MNYKEIIESVLANGVSKQATRYAADGSVIPVENGTIGTFCEIFRHDMAEGFPLTTLRKMPWKSIRVELEGFIKGITTKSWYQERGCKFWNEWANPHAVGLALLEKENGEALAAQLAVPIGGSEAKAKELYKKVQAETDDLGPVYGAQWRKFDQQYGKIDMEVDPNYPEGPDGQVEWMEINRNGVDEGVDQLKSIVEKLRSSPYDRRMVCSAWNPNQEHLMALPSCHVLHQVVVYGNKLNLTWFQRSVDSTHGLPSNIASYGLLMMLYCEESGLEPGELVGILSDCHLYENTLESARLMVERSESPLPKLEISRKSDGSFNIFDWTYDEVKLTGYDPHPAIDMGKVTV